MMPHIEKQDWWQLPVKIFSEITGLIVVPIVGALYGGRYLDNKFQTEPIYFIILTVLSIIIANVAIARLVGKYLKDINQAEKRKNYGDHDPSLDEK